MSKGYSTERHCHECGNTVDWKQYYLEAECCRECWFKRYRAIPDDKGGSPQSRWDDFMDYLEEMRNQ